MNFYTKYKYVFLIYFYNFSPCPGFSLFAKIEYTEMRKFLICILTVFISINASHAAGRDGSTVNRAATTDATPRTGAVSKKTARAAQSNIVKRESKGVASARSANTQKTIISSRQDSAKTVSRSAVSKNKTKTVSIARATTTPIATSNTFGTGYNTCRDAYFTCMDQFCANKDETYRRCICSSRLEKIKNDESAISETSGQLTNFKDLNINAIDKTGNEVKAMLSATTGEETAENTKDTSDSAKKLAGISDVLSSTKTAALSTGGKLDIAGDINSIWQTTDIASGSDIANLTGEKLYNAVNKQCEELVGNSCASQSVLDMVVSAYGMYIENDCTTLSNNLSNKKIEAQSAIRQTEYAMNDARLENYDAHNSTAINECLSLVRADITSDTACGTDYVHCLDVTGQYLNKDTGEPIYSSEFYQLELSTSLSGDVLQNQTNRLLLSELERKKDFAQKHLDTCRDISSDVWDEFLRQAITAIYQGQQTRIKQVKNECIDVVNNCYDTKNNSLKDFSDVKEQLLLGARMELSEEMCRTKLDTCSNLYGGGDSGLKELISTMTIITDQTIAQNCKTTLEEYLAELCAVPSNDTIHGYPFACRVYTPGEQRYVSSMCNSVKKSEFATAVVDYDDDSLFRYLINPSFSIVECQAMPTILISPSFCSAGVNVMYTTCNYGYYMTYNGIYNPTPVPGNLCSQCDVDNHYICNGGTSEPYLDIRDNDCGDYPGSLYQKLVNYALQACVRPSESAEEIPTEILEDVNRVMDKVKVDMASQLSNECERLGGIWVDTPGVKLDDGGFDVDLIENAGDIAYKLFYDETSANQRWGYCKYTNDCEDITYSYATSSCTTIDNNATLNGCVSIGCRCDISHMTYNGTCGNP